MKVKHRLMVVDDTKSQRNSLKKLFSDNKNIVVTCPETRAEFQNFVEKTYCNLYLVDINLSNWGAMSLKDAISLLPSNTHICLITSDLASTETHKAINAVMSIIKDKGIFLCSIFDFSHVTNDEKYKTFFTSSVSTLLEANSFSLLNDSNKLNLLLLSDPQYGDPDLDHWAATLSTAINSYMKLKNITIDLVLITGDITYSGSPQEFKDAAIGIKEVMSAIYPNEKQNEHWRKRLFMVPGNHDVDLKVMSSDVIDYNFSKKAVEVNNSSSQKTMYASKKLDSYISFYKKMKGGMPTLTTNNLNYIDESFVQNGIRFHLLNTVNQITLEQPGFQTFDIANLKELRERRSKEANITDILLCHEANFENIKSENETYLKTSETTEDKAKQDSTIAVLDYIQHFNIKLMLHGHYHEANISVHNSQGLKVESVDINESSFIKVMAPTSTLNGNKRAEKERRGFFLLALEKNKQGVLESVTVKRFELENNTVTEKDNKTFTVLT